MKKKSAIDILSNLIEGEITSGRLIRARRETLGLTQKMVSEMTGLQITFISAIENDRKSLGVETASKVAAAIGLHPGTILFPKGMKKSKELQDIERKREKILKRKIA